MTPAILMLLTARKLCEERFGKNVFMCKTWRKKEHARKSSCLPSVCDRAVFGAAQPMYRADHSPHHRKEEAGEGELIVKPICEHAPEVHESEEIKAEDSKELNQLLEDSWPLELQRPIELRKDLQE